MGEPVGDHAKEKNLVIEGQMLHDSICVRALPYSKLQKQRARRQGAARSYYLMAIWLH